MSFPFAYNSTHPTTINFFLPHQPENVGGEPRDTLLIELTLASSGSERSTRINVTPGNVSCSTPDMQVY